MAASVFEGCVGEGSLSGRAEGGGKERPQGARGEVLWLT